jgi:hypothetical protein
MTSFMSALDARIKCRQKGEAMSTKTRSHDPNAFMEGPNEQIERELQTGVESAFHAYFQFLIVETLIFSKGSSETHTQER